MEPESYTTHHLPYYNPEIPTQKYELGDFIEMESMQFVNPHEVNPILQNVSVQSASLLSQVSSKNNNMPVFGDLTQNNLKLKMEEFSDLSSLFSGEKIDLTGAIDELDTPVFDKDAFDFIPQSLVTSNENDCGVKVKVEYNAQIYSCGKNMYKDLSFATENHVQNKKNYSISKLGNDPIEMNLYQPYAHNVSYKDTMDDVGSNSYQDLHLFDSTAANNKMSSNNNLSVTSNIKYSNYTVPSPQEDRYSYISSPGNDQPADISMTDHDHSYETKPKLNLMIDQFKFPIKSEGPSMLNTPDVIDDVVNMGNGFNILDLINNEDITILSADEELMASLNSSHSLPPSTPTSISSQPSSPEKRSRRRKVTNADDDDDDDYVPPFKKRSTVRLTDIDVEDSNSSDDSDYTTKESIKKVKTYKARGRPPKRADSVNSDSSRDTNLSKYRELRDKNNEASRKSRLKRRVKELEYEQESDELRSKNIRLKAQVEELEKMVSTFRNNLFKILVNK